MHKVIPPLLALTILSLGAVAALSIDWKPAPGGAPAAAPGTLAAQPSAEQAAIAAVQAHLRQIGAGELVGIEAHALDEAGSYAICGRLGVADGPDVVARVIPTAGALMSPEGRQGDRAQASVARGMVVMEDGPGLSRGGAPGLPRERYCGPSPQPESPRPASLAEPAAPAPAATPPAGAQPAGAQPELAATDGITPGEGSVMVLSPVRVRSAPNGQSDILWVAERGRAFTVHAHAPGGWVQIGDGTAPAGWVHSSLLGSAM